MTHKREELLRRVRHVGIPVGVLLVGWQLVATLVADPTILPSPLHTFALALEFLTTEDIRGRTAVYHVQKTVTRVAIASSLSLGLSVIVGVAMWQSDFVEAIFSDWLPFWMTLPTVVVILVSMVVFRFSETSILVAVLVASAPFGIVNLWEGMKDIDTNLLEMSLAFDASTKQVWLDVYVPHLMPYIFGSYRYILGMVWKIVALAEIFGISNGIGAMFRFWYNQGRVDALLAYLLVFVVIMVALEYGVLAPLETRTFEWRDTRST